MTQTRYFLRATFDAGGGHNVKTCGLYGFGALKLIKLSGCTRTVWIGSEEIPPANDNIKGVKTVEGKEVKFDSEPRAAVEHDTIYATVGDQPYQIPLDQIEAAGARRADEQYSDCKAAISAWKHVRLERLRILAREIVRIPQEDLECPVLD